MTADKLEKRELFESYIRQVIEIAPGTAHAYNALGYSFLERNVRIAEGMKLVEKAFELAPDDAAIIDSVGWGYFRLGELEKSVTFLQRAFSLNPDPEIAAHLGEALEKTGRREESLKLLQEALQANPDHPALQSVIKKYHP